MSKRLIILSEEMQIILDRLENVESLLKKEHKQMEDPILGTDDLMNLLKVSRRSVQTWRDQGLIDFSPINGKFYYRISAINKMLDKHLKKAEE
jgi:hypothetical protein